jgi:hypothetical protein
MSWTGFGVAKTGLGSTEKGLHPFDHFVHGQRILQIHRVFL